MNTPKLLGILGGLGPMSSAYLYEYITAHTKVSSDQEHIDIILSSRSSTPDRTAFITGEGGESPLPVMIEDARRLEKYGAVGALSYQRELEEMGMKWTLPSERSQKILGELIYDSVKAGKDVDTDRFYSVVGELEGNGADAMILGCTELSVINRSLEHDPRLVDSTEALAYYAIGLCGKTPTGFPSEFSIWKPEYEKRCP